MAIDYSLLVSAAILQDYFVDNVTGQAMSGGIITCYKDNSRTTLKNWYYQTGTPGNYTYLPLPNPLVLSDVGTIEDANGVDTIPFFYPFSESNSSIREPYYITVVNSDNQRQFVRANFPFDSQANTPPSVPTNSNLIINNEFWRNIGSLTPSSTNSKSIKLNGVSFYYNTIAPSQHEGMPVMSDIQFYRDQQDATDTITFENFVTNFSQDQVIPDSITPEFYLNHNCTGTGTETHKYYQFPIQLHVDSLSGVENCRISIAAMAVTGAPSITLSIFQYLGDGVTSNDPIVIETIPLSNTWEKYITPSFTMPSAQGLTLGVGGDDCLYLQIGMPVSTEGVCDINFAVPSIYLSATVPTNDFQTYDEINAVISSPRIADVRISMDDYMFGYVPMNNGTIGDSSSNATARKNADTWPLYNKLWNKFHAYNISTTNPLAQMVTSAGSNVAYGSDAISDFKAHNAITLTATMGKVILGTVPVSSLLAAYATTFTASSSTGLLITAANTVNFFNGMPIWFSNTGGALPTGLVANTIYYVAKFNGTTQFYVSTSFANAMAGTVISYTNAGSGTNSFTAAFNGTFEGEYGHTLLLNEMRQHTHDPSAANRFIMDTGNFDNAYNQGTYNGFSSTTGGITGFTGQTAFNVTQPGAFFNLFMKL